MEQIETKAKKKEEDEQDEEFEEKSIKEEFKKYIETKKAEKKKEEVTSIIREVMKTELKSLPPQGSPMINPGEKFDQLPIRPEVKKYKEIINDPKAPIEMKYEAAKELHNAIDPTGAGTLRTNGIGMIQRDFEVKSMNQIELKHFEFKAQMEHDTGKPTDTDYLQSAPFLNDIYDPVIISHLNDKTTLYGLLRKVNASNYSDRYGFRVRTGRVAGAGGDTSTYNYDEGATLTGQIPTYLKLQIPFMWYATVIQVSGQAIASARGRGGIGDIFSENLKWGTADMLRGINADLYDSSGNSAGMTAGGKILSLNFLVDDGGTHTTLYGLDRASANATLRGTDTAKTGTPNPTKTDLRTAVQTAEKNGANHNDLFFVCDHIQKDKILGLLDDAQRFTNTSARAGFEGLPTFDGIPIHADDQCDDGFIYLLDAAHTFIAVQTPPTFEDLAKTDDSKKGFIKTYLSLVCTAPNHNYKYTGFATT